MICLHSQATGQDFTDRCIASLNAQAKEVDHAMHINLVQVLVQVRDKTAFGPPTKAVMKAIVAWPFIDQSTMEIEVANEGRDDHGKQGEADLRVIVLMMAVTIDGQTGEETRLPTLFSESTSGFSLLYDLALPIEGL